MSGSKCQRCGFVDWVEGVQCKQCGQYLDGLGGSADTHAGNRLPDKKRLSRFGLALSSLYLLIVLPMVGASFSCGRFGGGERWPAIFYCLMLTLTVCAFPWPFVLGIISKIPAIPPGVTDWLLVPYSLMGIAVNALLLYRFGKEVTKSPRSSDS